MICINHEIKHKKLFILNIYRQKNLEKLSLPKKSVFCIWQSMLCHLLIINSIPLTITNSLKVVTPSLIKKNNLHSLRPIREKEPGHLRQCHLCSLSQRSAFKSVDALPPLRHRQRGSAGVRGPQARKSGLSASRQDNAAIPQPAPADNAPHMPLGEC